LIVGSAIVIVGAAAVSPVLGLIAAGAAGLYLVIRLAVQHATKATRS
jgi:hypothetical protein